MMRLPFVLALIISGSLAFSQAINFQQVAYPEELITDSVSINDFFRVMTDSTNSLTIENFLVDDIQLGKLIPPLDREYAHWGKLILENRFDRTRFYFINVGKNDYIDCYIVENGQVFDTLKSGYLYPISEQSVPRGSYYLPVQIRPRTTLELYIRIKEEIHRDPEFNIKVYSGKQWIYKILDTYIIDFIFQGIFWIIILYNIYAYSATKIRAFLLYSIYLFFISITYLFLTDILREYILKSIPLYTIYFVPMTFMTMAAYWLFVREFLNAKRNFILYAPWMNRIAVANFALYLMNLVYIHFTHEIYLPTAILRIIALINMVLVIGLIYRLFGSKNEMVKFFVCGTSTMVVMFVIELVFWDPNTSQAALIKYGLLVEIAIFSLGLSHKKKLFEKEKRKELRKQIDQLKVNESLAQWQKEELEKIIDSRTKKIKKKNKKLKKAIIRAEDATKVKADFLSVMSHEIRTPMNAVIGTVHLLLGENPSTAQLDHLKTLKFSSENLLILINDILDYSKIESGNVKLETIDFDLRELTKGLENTHNQRASENGVAFNILIDHNIPSLLKGDPARLTQILNNLISNAIKFTPKGEIKLLIHLLNRSRGRVKLEFAVEDTGIGISKENLNLIFESFTQAHAETTRKYGGTGLGLAITKQLIKLFDSQIFVKSKENKGSKFYFSLFMEEAAHANAASVKDNSEMIKRVKGKRVLVVDDNEINLMMVEKFLNKWEMYCDVVVSGKDALTQLLNNNYDIILMDLQMPEMDGYEVSATIRALDNDNLSRIPIVAVSADTYDNVKYRIAKVGMNDFLSKPFNPGELLGMVHEYTKEQLAS